MLRDIQGSPPPSSEAMHPTKRKLGKYARRPPWVDKDLLRKQSERLVVQLPGWREGIQRELHTLERRGNANLMKLTKGQGPVLQQCQAHSQDGRSG